MVIQMGLWLDFKTWSMLQYGSSMYRIPVDPGWGCPHRRPGSPGVGCSFCGPSSGRAQQLGNDPLDILAQVDQAIQFSRERYGEGVLQLYIQAYTATFSKVEALRKLVEPLLEGYAFVSLSLGTRPDCLPTAHLDLLEEWNQHVEVWVELGVQTCHEMTLKRVNREHTWKESERAIIQLQARGLRVCPHLLFGLPDETSDDMFETLDRIVSLNVDAVKFHNLHVVRESSLGDEWLAQPFPVLDEPAWLELVMQLLRRMPPDLPLFRLFTDSSSAERLAPPPQYSKGEFLKALSDQLAARGWFQGQLWEGRSTSA